MSKFENGERFSFLRKRSAQPDTMMSKFKIRELTICAVCVALAVVLSNIKLFSMPQSGSVTPCSMFFIVLAGYWFGPAAGLMSGAAMGLLDLLMGGYVVHPAQLLLDYPLAFGLLGLSGFFRNMKHGLPIGYVVGVFGRFLMHFLSGVIFFASYAQESGQPLMLYSAVYNGLYLLPEVVATLAVIHIPAFKKALDRVKNWDAA